jgi:UDP-glucose:(heptosyl)LPS alpha-1,3-glucosyltransferase
MCLALRRAGWRLVYDPAVAVDHYPASRSDADPRDGLAPHALQDEVHNETYALARWLPARRKLVAVAYAVLVGSRRAPGLLVALEGSLGRERRRVLARLRIAQRARLHALRTALRARRPRVGRGARATVTIVAHDVGTPGGMERQLGELCRGLLARGHGVIVVARRCEIPPHPHLRWVRVRVPRRPFSVAYPAFFFAGTLAVWRHREGVLHTTGAVICSRADLSTVHFCHDGFRAAGGGSRASRERRAHRLNTTASDAMSRVAERLCLRPSRTRRLVAVSGGVARELEGLFGGRSEIVVIPNGVDRVRFAPDPPARARVRDRMGLGAGDLVALFVGGDWERKGLRWAIEGVASAPGWHLVVVGQGDERRHRAHARNRGVADRVHFTGGTPDTAPWYAAADAFVLPTVYEAFPLVLLEAAAAALPLLAGRVSGAEELICDGENGWFVERDGADIGERLRALGADAALRAAMGAAARERSAGYTWDRVVEAYVKLYASAARGSSTTNAAIA